MRTPRLSMRMVSCWLNKISLTRLSRLLTFPSVVLAAMTSSRFSRCLCTRTVAIAAFEVSIRMETTFCRAASACRSSPSRPGKGCGVLVYLDSTYVLLYSLDLKSESPADSAFCSMSEGMVVAEASLAVGRIRSTAIMRVNLRAGWRSIACSWTTKDRI